MNRQETLAEISRLANQWVTSGGNSPDAKQVASITIPFQNPITPQVIAITDTFSSLLELGAASEELDFLLNILTKFNGIMALLYNRKQGGASGPIVLGNSDLSNASTLT